MYTELCEALRWRRPMAGSDRLRSTLQGHAARRFDSFDRRCKAEHNGPGGQLIDRLKSLPGRRFDALIASPQGFYATSRQCPVDVAEEYFEGAVAVEEIRLGQVPASKHRQIWSALGDTAYSLSDDDKWNLDFEAAELGGFLPVDTRCPATRGEIPGVPTKSSTISVDDEAAIVALLREALSIIEAANAVTLQFLIDFARVIVARQTSEDDGFHSAGARITPGRMVMTNPLRRFDKAESIVDALVHEAIHCAIDHCEFEKPILTLGRTDDMIRSPWTGKPLDLNTFVQACCVWYGLTHFWQGVVQNPRLRSKGSEAMLAQARKGFGKANPVSTVEQYAASFDPELIEAIQCMREIT